MKKGGVRSRGIREYSRVKATRDGKIVWTGWVRHIGTSGEVYVSGGPEGPGVLRPGEVDILTKEDILGLVAAGGSDYVVLLTSTEEEEVISGSKKQGDVQLGLSRAAEVDPSHYDFPGGVQVVDIARHLDFLSGNVVKYVARAGRKGDRLTDLLKARQYLDWLIEGEQG